MGKLIDLPGMVNDSLVSKPPCSFCMANSANVIPFKKQNSVLEIHMILIEINKKLSID
jgi:hypothetical protein